MSTIIAITTDFGTRDGYVGAMKGRILSICNDVVLVDLSHEIAAQDISGAAWCIARAAPNFPRGTIHLVVVDPEVGSGRRGIVFRAGGQIFVGPDNGVFDRLLDRYQPEDVRAIRSTTPWWSTHSTFDGLALFAPVAAHLARGLAPSKIGTRTTIEPRLTQIPALRERDRIVGRIEIFDRFGNGITTIPSALIDPEMVARCRGACFPIADHYAAVEEGEPLALIDSDDRLELAVRNGSARAAFGLERGDEVDVEPADR